MLQQTQVFRVIPKYKIFIKGFPDCNQLAQSTLREILIRWSGLGYNRRALLLHCCARSLVHHHNGAIPHDVETLQTLPGIGPYTARAILIFAWNDDISTVDANIRRILIHEFALLKATPDTELYAVADLLLPRGKSREWHNALMDYGSEVLTSRYTHIKPKTIQSAFHGSQRWYRGKIIRSALHGPVAVKDLQKKLKLSPHELHHILTTLHQDVLIGQVGEYIEIATATTYGDS